MAAPKDVLVPDIGDFKDIPVIEVLVKPGDHVKAEESLITLESDKATMEVPAPFDGVIKESVSVKTDAFVDLFRPYGRDVCEQVRKHHLANGGMSRYQKMPTYLN